MKTFHCFYTYLWKTQNMSTYSYLRTRLNTLLYVSNVLIPKYAHIWFKPVKSGLNQFRYDLDLQIPSRCLVVQFQIQAKAGNSTDHFHQTWLNPKDWVKTTGTTTAAAAGETTTTTAAAGETTSTTGLLCQTLIIEEKPGNYVAIKKFSA